MSSLFNDQKETNKGKEQRRYPVVETNSSDKGAVQSSCKTKLLSRMNLRSKINEYGEMKPNSEQKNVLNS